MLNKILKVGIVVAILVSLVVIFVLQAEINSGLIQAVNSLSQRIDIIQDGVITKSTIAQFRPSTLYFIGV